MSRVQGWCVLRRVRGRTTAEISWEFLGPADWVSRLHAAMVFATHQEALKGVAEVGGQVISYQDAVYLDQLSEGQVQHVTLTKTRWTRALAANRLADLAAELARLAGEWECQEVLPPTDLADLQVQRDRLAELAARVRR